MMKFLDDISPRKLKGTAVVRLDFNTEDDWRMDAVLPTLRFLLEKGAKIIILSHRGRPPLAPRRKDGRVGGIGRAFSLRRDAKELSRKLRHPVKFIPHFNFTEIKRVVHAAAPKSVFLLENIRLLKGEVENSRALGRRFASLGDFYVNDAFAVSHRANASVEAITHFFPSYAGFELKRELKHLSHAIKRPRHPLVMIFGGGKGRDKLRVIRFFKNKADHFILGGAPSNTVLKIMGLNVGGSIVDTRPEFTLKEILRYRNILLPTDYKVKDKMILDIGPNTVKFFSSIIRKARTVVWGGPVGRIEDPRYRAGTLGIARAIARNRKAFSIAGGGETVMFLKKYGLDKKFSFISTGGGAMLDFLAGERLPGIEALKKQ